MIESSDSREIPQEISVIQDEQGIAFLGDGNTITKWLDEQGITSHDIKINAVKGALRASDAVQKAAEVSSQSGRWVKLTKESASLVAKYGSNSAVQSGVVRDGGKIVKHLKFEKIGSLANPSMAAGLAGVMTQMALEQAIQEITDYLKQMDSKINLLLQDQKDQAVSKLLGIEYLVNEARLVYKRIGAVPDTTWSKLAGCPQDLAQTQSYALLKIEGLAKALKKAHSSADIEKASRNARDEIQQWLEVSAKVIQLQNELSVLELNRALTDNPETVEQLKSAILEAKYARERELEDKSNQLVQELQGKSDRVREKKLLHPFAVDDSLENLNTAAAQLHQFAELIEVHISEAEISNAPRWHKVAGQFLGKAVSDAKDFGDKTANEAKQIQSIVAEKVKLRQKKDDDSAEEGD